MKVKYGTYHLGDRKIEVKTDLSESELAKIVRENPVMAKFIKIKADDNDNKESDNDVEVVAEPKQSKPRGKRKPKV
jgi:hypothetical protein